MSFLGVELNAQINRLIFEIRLQLSRNKYTPNLRTIYRSCADYDNQVSGIIQPHQFEHALNANGIFIKKYELQAFQKAFGQNGKINWFGFLGRLREPMGPLRRQLVEHIFDSIDVDKKKALTTTQLMERFNTNEIQVYRLGKKSAQEVKAGFLSLLPIVNDIITRQEFIAFYDDTNINYAHNDIFIRHVSNLWHYTTQKLTAVKEDLIRNVTKNLRYKLIQKSQGTKDDLLVRKLFQEYDQSGNFYLSSYDLDSMMKKLGVAAEGSVVETLHQRIDKNNSGYIQFEEFKKFLYYDPYPF